LVLLHCMLLLLLLLLGVTEHCTALLVCRH
jgi:hypothetical protein